MTRRALSVAIDARYVKALAASSRQDGSHFNFFRNDPNAHVLAVVPLGNADPTFETAAPLPFDSH